LPLTYSAVLRGQAVTYRVVISHRARSWRLSIHPHTGLCVVLPARSRLAVANLLETHADWIQRTLDRAARRPVPRQAPLAHDSPLPYLGTVLRLEIDRLLSGLPRLDLERRTLRVGALGPRRLVEELEAWYRQQARALFPERLQVLNATLGFRFARVAIRDQRTRWGSCSAAGNLAFNWRLVMAPLAIVDSVVAHELTHLVDPSHAPSFWRRLAAIDPEYRVHRGWLRRYGSWLALGCESPPGLP
jgi:predicted metal-dependent hydrolase